MYRERAAAREIERKQLRTERERREFYYTRNILIKLDQDTTVIIKKIIIKIFRHEHLVEPSIYLIYFLIV